jgi:alpha-D-ribose 1-methylphosphonate 5-triphosphate synthase subunit PhnG
VAAGLQLRQRQLLHGHQLHRAAASVQGACGIVGQGLGLTGLAGVDHQHGRTICVDPLLQAAALTLQRMALLSQPPGHARAQARIAQHQRQRATQTRRGHNPIHHADLKTIAVCTPAAENPIH